ncbi:putative Ig domain-containing protein [Variovorax sp. YR216]|uniref:putative Ig domain-containing protein n=1 Tax=Variovorax sp. YR216 TaxID=1882828 RepID=UPI000B869351
MQYTVTGANSAGDVQARISIAVQDATGIIGPPPTFAPPATISYEDAGYVGGQPIVPNVPALTGGPPTLFAASPVLPAGLSLVTTTGIISGAPTIPQDATAYAVAASNSAAQAQTTLT